MDKKRAEMAAESVDLESKLDALQADRLRDQVTRPGGELARLA